MRAVLDTNVLISGLFWKGAPHRCLLAAEGKLFDLVLSEPGNPSHFTRTILN